MRQTERKVCYPECDKQGNITKVDYIDIKDKKMAEEKLCQLEDKEELCIKMTTQPIYEKFSKTNIYKLDYTGYNAAYDFKNNCIILYEGHKATIYFINEYGKTWSLTKEELE